MSHPATWRTTPDDDPTDTLLCGMAPVREAVNQPALTPVLTLYGKPSLIYACIAAHGAMTRKQLAQLLGLPRGTVENATRSLVTRQLLRRDLLTDTFNLTHLRPVRYQE